MADREQLIEVVRAAKNLNHVVRRYKHSPVGLHVIAEAQRRYEDALASVNLTLDDIDG